jgi:acyl-CoA synthetase (AMP-forming)/AMP-acid ligase II
LPINHVGCVVDISTPTLVDGGCIIFMEDFDPETAMQLMERERISIWASVPSVFLMQLALPSLPDFDLSAVELIVWEGAAMPIEAIRQLLEFGKPLATNYGMTETTSAITIVDPTRDEDRLANSVGTPFGGVDVRLVTADGTIAAPGEPGEIQARSVLNMQGYWGRPEETAATILPGGWLRTGDLAVERPDGNYQIVGRLKEMFKSGGYNVYPREVENVLEAHPKVELAAVVSIHDDVWQEVGIAFVQRRDAVTEAELEQHCRAHLANYKVPKKFVIMTELPLLPIGKVDKNALQQLAERSGEISLQPPGAPQPTK